MTVTRSRTTYALVLDVALLTLSAFYLFAPTVSVYASELSMSYGAMPGWFAATPPAVLTARVFADYNAQTPRAERFQRQLTCFLTDRGGRRKPGCMHELHAGDLAYGPDALMLASGQYLARFAFSGLDDCHGGDVRLEVRTAGRFGRLLAAYNGSVAPGDRLELPFRLRLMDAALAPVEFRIGGVGGCALLGHADWTNGPASMRVAPGS